MTQKRSRSVRHALIPNDVVQDGTGETIRVMDYPISEY